MDFIESTPPRELEQKPLKRFWSESSKQFFDEGMPADGIPSDAVPVKENLYLELSGWPLNELELRDGRLVHAALPIAQTKAQKIAEVRSIASRMILEVAPVWKQVNDARDLSAGLGTASEEQLKEKRAKAAARIAMIDLIREASDEIMKELEASTDTSSIDVTKHSKWPGKGTKDEN